MPLTARHGRLLFPLRMRSGQARPSRAMPCRALSALVKASLWDLLGEQYESEGATTAKALAAVPKQVRAWGHAWGHASLHGDRRPPCHTWHAAALALWLMPWPRPPAAHPPPAAGCACRTAGRRVTSPTRLASWDSTRLPRSWRDSTTRQAGWRDAHAYGSRSWHRHGNVQRGMACAVHPVQAAGRACSWHPCPAAMTLRLPCELMRPLVPGAPLRRRCQRRCPPTFLEKWRACAAWVGGSQFLFCCHMHGLSGLLRRRKRMAESAARR